MLFGKIENDIVSHLQSGSDKILIIDGARQIGKSAENGGYPPTKHCNPFSPLARLINVVPVIPLRLQLYLSFGSPVRRTSSFLRLTTSGKLSARQPFAS